MYTTVPIRCSLYLARATRLFLLVRWCAYSRTIFWHLSEDSSAHTLRRKAATFVFTNHVRHQFLNIASHNANIKKFDCDVSVLSLTQNNRFVCILVFSNVTQGRQSRMRLIKDTRQLPLCKLRYYTNYDDIVQLADHTTGAVTHRNSHHWRELLLWN